MSRAALADRLAVKRSTLRLKAEDIAPDGSFRGYGSVFGFVDTYGDVVAPGAYTASLERHKAEGSKVKMLWQHDPGEPVGVWSNMFEDRKGLVCEGQLILDVARAREALALLRCGALDGLSIGFEAAAWEMGKPEDYEARFGGICCPPGGITQVRVVTQIDLWEVSLVTFPACPPALIETVKRQLATPTPALKPPSSDEHDLTPGHIARLAAALERRAEIIPRMIRRLT